MVLIHDTDPDIIICDIRMPKLDGIALINEVLPSHPSLQVIFFSGYSDKEYLKNAIKLEAVDYLYKPLQLHELIGAVEKAKKKCMNKKVHLPQNEADLALSLLQCSENEIPSDLPLDLHAPLVTVIAADEYGGRAHGRPRVRQSARRSAFGFSPLLGVPNGRGARVRW